MQNIAELYKKPMRNRHHHHRHLLATYAKSRQLAEKYYQLQNKNSLRWTQDY